MTIKVKFFAILRERAGKAEILKEMRAGSTVGELWQALKQDYPKLAPADLRLLYAVNRSYVTPDHVLNDGDEVAIIPPVSGG